MFKKQKAPAFPWNKPQRTSRKKKVLGFSLVAALTAGLISAVTRKPTP